MTTGTRRYVACSAQLLTRGLPGKQVGEVTAQTIRNLERAVTYPTRWYFLLLHKAHPGDLTTTTYPLSYLHFGLNPDWMGQKISEQGQDWEVPLPLLPNLCYIFPTGIYGGDINFLQILKLLSGYLQWSIHNFRQNYTVLSQETFSEIRCLCLALILSYSFIPPICFSVRNTSSNRINHTVFKMVHSIHI